MIRTIALLVTAMSFISCAAPRPRERGATTGSAHSQRTAVGDEAQYQEWGNTEEILRPANLEGAPGDVFSSPTNTTYREVRLQRALAQNVDVEKLQPVIDVGRLLEEQGMSHAEIMRTILRNLTPEEAAYVASELGWQPGEISQAPAPSAGEASSQEQW